MNECLPIKTIIIDDNKEYLASLIEHLSLFPEIELEGFASQYTKAIKLLTKSTPDLVFMDIEMPGKNGFELLAEARQINKSNFGVIFFTAYDKYMVNALRDSAFDYILKPINPNELKCSIHRFKTFHTGQGGAQDDYTSGSFSEANEIISLPTNTGLKFVNKNTVILVHCIKEFSADKPYWRAMLTDNTQVKLRAGITAKELLCFLGHNEYVQVNQSSIVNIGYLQVVEYKTRECLLMPPFDHFRLTASRTHLSDIKDRFDLL